MKIQTISEEKEKELNKALSTVEKNSEKFIKISDKIEYDSANEFLVKVKTKEKEFEDERKGMTDPINKGLDAINSIYMPKIKRCKEISSIVKEAMSSYLREEKRKQDEEAEKIRIEQEKKNNLRESKGLQPIEFDEPEDLVEAIDTRSETKSGKSSAKSEWKFKIVSIKDIPQKYFDETLKLAIEKGLLDTVLKEAVKSGERNIKGLDIYEDFNINVYIKK
ncbi:MAG: hypothetical protein WC438_06160 [Candidatus Pacearchaeota archaeon]